jgi:diguanylate cyclase (GGDEF)-like protein/PAS domain S-box-containing protein
MFKKLTSPSTRAKNNTIETMIKNFQLPMFYKYGKNSYITNSAFDTFAGDNRQKVLNQIISLNTTNKNKFELELVNDIGQKIESMIYISNVGEDEKDKLGIIVDIGEQNSAKHTINSFKERYELATNGSNEGLWDFDVKSGEVFYSNRFKEIIGYGTNPIKNHISSWINTILPQDKARVAKALEDHINGKTPNFQAEHRIKINNTIRWVSIRGKKSHSQTTNSIRVVGFLTDITDIKEAQLALKDSQEQFELFMENLPAGAFIKDENNNFLFSNKYLNDFFGVDTLEGKTVSDVISQEDQKNIIKNEELVQKGTVTTEEKLADKMGIKHYFQTHRFVINKNKQKLFGGIYSDISEQKKTETKLNILAHYDLLTNLPNRALFQDSLKNAISKAKRSNGKIALMFIDLDNFKMINDTLGHDYGDLLLIEVAKRVKAVLRTEDTVSRLGGDEFTVILEDIQDTSYPSVVAQKIIDTLSEPIQLKDEMGYIGASVGIAIFPDDADTIETLIKNADMAMYTAKNGGKNVYKYFKEDMTADATERLELSNDLRTALSNNQLKLHYQPIMNIETNNVEAFEALVRWEHPKYGIISPENFIKLAEEGGFMAKVGKWILKKSCQQIKFMQSQGVTAKVTVNISSKQLTQNNLEQTLKGIINDSGINPNMLELEVTENFLMENIDQVHSVLSNLQKIGIQTAIDNFGTGYSSLKHLTKLPISKLKIDKSFVDDIPKDKEDMKITETIITLAHQLSLEVVAEGVETQSQVEFLKSKGCNLMQGYYFSKAIPESEINSYIKEINITA